MSGAWLYIFCCIANTTPSSNPLLLVRNFPTQLIWKRRSDHLAPVSNLTPHSHTIFFLVLLYCVFFFFFFFFFFFLFLVVFFFWMWLGQYFSVQTRLSLGKRYSSLNLNLVGVLFFMSTTDPSLTQLMLDEVLCPDRPPFRSGIHELLWLYPLPIDIWPWVRVRCILCIVRALNCDGPGQIQ